MIHDTKIAPHALLVVIADCDDGASTSSHLDNSFDDYSIIHCVSLLLGMLEMWERLVLMTTEVEQTWIIFNCCWCSSSNYLQ